MPPIQSVKTLHSTKPCIDKTLVLCPHCGAGVNICVVLSSKAGNQPALLGLSLWKVSTFKYGHQLLSLCRRGKGFLSLVWVKRGFLFEPFAVT